MLQNRALLTLMLGHLTVDMYAGVLPVLYPLLTDEFDLSLKSVGMVSLAYSGMSSISQPFFGWVTDKRGTRLIGLALMWTAGTFSLIGLASSFTMVLILAGLAGIGSGAYHPMGAVSASAVISDKQRNTAMSIYVVGGTLGVAIGPLLGALLFVIFGISGTVALIIPGASIAIWMLFQMRSISANMAANRKSARAAPPIPWFPLGVIIGLMMMRSWMLFGISAFVPTWYEEMGYRPIFYASLSTTLLISSALGTVGVGSLADRRGRKSLLVWSSVLSVPTILLFAQFPGIPGFFSAAAIGILAASTGPLLLVMAQQLMVGRPGVASGLILGLGFVMGAIGVPIMGAVADVHGIQNAIRLWALIAIGSIFLALLLPTDAEVAELASRPPASAGGAPLPLSAAAADGD